MGEQCGNPWRANNYRLHPGYGDQTIEKVIISSADETIYTEAVDYHLRLLDFAAALGQPLVACHGYVGRVRPVNSLTEEWTLFVQAVRRIAERPHQLGLQLVIEVLNRGPIILECTAPGPDPFAPIKGEDSIGWLETYLRESQRRLRDHLESFS